MLLTCLQPPQRSRMQENIFTFIYLFYFLFFFAGPPGDRGREHSSLDLAEQRIIVSGVGLAVGSHGEEGRSAVYLSL